MTVDFKYARLPTDSHGMTFEHPNAKGVLMPGQSKCHIGRLVPRGTGDEQEDPVCRKTCSPTGDFPNKGKTERLSTVFKHATLKGDADLTLCAPMVPPVENIEYVPTAATYTHFQNFPFLSENWYDADVLPLRLQGLSTVWRDDEMVMLQPVLWRVCDVV